MIQVMKKTENSVANVRYAILTIRYIKPAHTEALPPVLVAAKNRHSGLIGNSTPLTSSVTTIKQRHKSNLTIITVKTNRNG